MWWTRPGIVEGWYGMRMRAKCPEHGSLCAYTGTEADRCPFCHALWPYIQLRVRLEGVQGHSCEVYYVWAKSKRGNVETARELRLSLDTPKSLLQVRQERPEGLGGTTTHPVPTNVPEPPSVASEQPSRLHRLWNLIRRKP